MQHRYANRILAWALGASIAIHIAFAFLAHGFHQVRAQEPPKIGRLTITRLTPVPAPTPKPTPRPTPTPRPSIQPKRTPHPVVALGPPRHSTKPPTLPRDSAHPRVLGTPIDDGGASGGPDPYALVTGPPVPAETVPPPSCAHPNVAAHVTHVVPPDVPQDLAQAIQSTASIAVTLSAAGSVLGTSVYSSAGLFPLDRAAMAAARASTYTPSVRNCVPIGGTYLFTVTFQS